MSEETGRRLTEEYRWSYARTNSKGEKIYKHDTEQTAKYDKKEEPDMPDFPFTSLADKERYKFIDGKWWYYYPADGVTGGKKRESAESLNNKYLRKKKKLLTHMYVGGKRVDESHPLFKPGKYPGFTEAAFNSLDNYKVNSKGQLYVMYSPSFPSWCKVGMAVDAEDRVKHFQTSSPYRDYELIKVYNVQNRRKAEKKAHKILQDKYVYRNEWFVASAAQVITILDQHFGVEQFELF